MMNNQFSENLKKIRKEHHLSQEQLAEELGVSRQAISKWESSVAYPEMDKIISLCDKFNLNIDDLLHRDIKEVKGEEASKKKINKYIDDILRFMTDTVNMFMSMSFKSKVKCIIEQVIIIFVLFIISNVLLSVVDMLFSGILGFIPSNIYVVIKNIFDSIVRVFCIIVSLIVLIHIFKTRYLDYFDNIEKDSDDSSIDNKVVDFKKGEKKIVIRDPKHSEYKFLNGLFKFIFIFIKFFMLCFGLFMALMLVGLFSLFIMSFLVSKTGLFFVGLVLCILGASVIDIVILLLILNFVFDRKNNKKKIIWSFILSVIIFGMGCGCIFVGSLNFEVFDDNKNMLKTVSKEYDMRNDLVIYSYSDRNSSYVESDISNVKIEYTINKYCDVDGHVDDNGITAWVSCSKPMKLARVFLKNLNDKKIIPISDSIDKMVIYASRENIDKLKSNLNRYYEDSKDMDDRFHSYEKEIDDLNSENNELRQEVSELREELENSKRG